MRTPANGQRRVVCAGAAPVALFGANVVGIVPTAGTSVARRSAAAGRIGGSGGAPGLAWAVQAGAAQHPVGAIGRIALLVRYAREWWLAVSP